MTFLLAGIFEIELFGDHQAQNAVAQKLEPFIIAIGPSDTRMGERQPQHCAVLEVIAETFGEFLIFRFREADHGFNRLY